MFSKHYNKDISGLSIDSKIEIPIKSGMGSSAAYAHSALLALLTYFKLTVTKEETYLFVFECEKYIHGTPSGIDPFSVVYGGVYSFQKELKTGEIIKEKLELPKEYIFLLIDSGQASESTGEMVKKVSDDYKRNKKTQVILKDIGLISQKIKKELQLGTFSGELLDENQKLLEEIGVVGITAKQKVSLLRKNVAHVKITGAGGIKTGSGLLLVYVENLEKLDEIKTICKMNTWEYLETKVK